MPPLSSTTLRKIEVSALVWATLIGTTSFIITLWPTGPEFPVCGSKPGEITIDAEALQVGTSSQLIEETKCRRADDQRLVKIGATEWNPGQITHYIKGEIYQPGFTSTDINLSGWPDKQQLRVQVYTCGTVAYNQLGNARNRDPQGRVVRLPDGCEPISNPVTMTKVKEPTKDKPAL
ncbi:hypothetical protein [Streptomyces sp. NPDC059272]|uniref:hypothetical protein n=1 Tax=Streptomyces sp. NPDC059272 TaxID=3346800 RepID=UPI0036B18D29